MANTYTQIHLHLIFVVKYRAALIHDTWETELHKYISGIIAEHKHKLIIINGMPDHLHILIGMRPHESLSDLMQAIKGSSSLWINGRKFLKSKFAWQDGYAAFSYGKSQLPDVIEYIKNQKEHHKKISFMEEVRKFLELFEVEFDEKYLLKEPE